MRRAAKPPGLEPSAIEAPEPRIAPVRYVDVRGGPEMWMGNDALDTEAYYCEADPSDTASGGCLVQRMAAAREARGAEPADVVEVAAVPFLAEVLEDPDAIEALEDEATDEITADDADSVAQPLRPFLSIRTGGAASPWWSLDDAPIYLPRVAGSVNASPSRSSPPCPGDGAAPLPVLQLREGGDVPVWMTRAPPFPRPPPPDPPVVVWAHRVALMLVVAALWTGAWFAGLLPR